MREFKKILVYLAPAGRPDPGLDHAVGLAKQIGAAVTVVDVLRRPSGDMTRFFPAKAALDDAAKKPLLERLERVVDQVSRGGGAAPSTKLLTGRPVPVVAKEVLDGEYDLVVRTSSPDDAESPFFGTTALRLVAQCNCPVWIVQPSALERPRIVLAAVDLANRERSAAAASVLAHAAAFAELFSGRLHILHAIDPEPFDLLDDELSPAEMNAWSDGVRAERSESLQQLVQDSGTSVAPEHQHLVEMAAGHAIVRLVEDHEVDVVVLGTTSDGPGTPIMGSAAERILRRLKCSVLAVRAS